MAASEVAVNGCLPCFSASRATNASYMVLGRPAGRWCRPRGRVTPCRWRNRGGPPQSVEVRASAGTAGNRRRRPPELRPGLGVTAGLDRPGTDALFEVLRCCRSSCATTSSPARHRTAYCGPDRPSSARTLDLGDRGQPTAGSETLWLRFCAANLFGDVLVAGFSDNPAPLEPKWWRTSAALTPLRRSSAARRRSPAGRTALSPRRGSSDGSHIIH